MDNPLSWLEDWYAAQCDGDWEHDYGVTFQTLDNPGWSVNVDFVGTDFEASPDRIILEIGEPPGATNQNIGGPVWMTCKVEKGRFVGAGDPAQLWQILECLRDFLANPPADTSSGHVEV